MGDEIPTFHISMYSYTPWHEIGENTINEQLIYCVLLCNCIRTFRGGGYKSIEALWFFDGAKDRRRGKDLMDLLIPVEYMIRKEIRIKQSTSV